MEAGKESRPTLTVYRGLPGSGYHIWSPFVVKLEARLRFAGLAYRTESGSIPKAPRGKIPYISLSKTEIDGRSSEPALLLGDTAIISKELVRQGLMDDLNAQLSPLEKAQDLALRALLDDKVYYYQVTPSVSHALYYLLVTNSCSRYSCGTKRQDKEYPPKSGMEIRSGQI